MNFDETQDFKREFKKLSKKYHSLGSDLEELKKVLTNFPLGTGKNFILLREEDSVNIVKGRLFCQSLKKSSLRIVYAYHDKVVTFVFLELFSKSDKSREDKKRISQYLLELKKSV